MRVTERPPAEDRRRRRSCSISLKLARQDGGEAAKETVPVQFEIDGARSEVAVELAGPEAELKDHRIPLEKGKERGWGRVSIPADANPADNDFCFVFEQPVARKAIVVAEDAAAARPLAAGRGDLAGPGRPVRGGGARAGPARRRGLGPGRPAALAGAAARQATRPSRSRRSSSAAARRSSSRPAAPGDGELFGVRWTAWQEPKIGGPGRGLAGRPGPAGPHPERHAAAGRPAPGPARLRALRRRADGAGDAHGAALRCWPGRRPTAGGVYFCATTPAGGDSSLATNGVVLYVMVQRAMAAGAAVAGQHAAARRRRAVAGDDPARWKRVAGGEEAISTEYAAHRGVYASGDRLLAVNRSAAEESRRRPGRPPRRRPVPRARLRRGSTTGPAVTSSLIQEIWRLFLSP